MSGAGEDIWGTADAFRYVYQPLTGDGEIVARVVSVQNTNAWVKAGVMLRADLTPGAAQAMMMVTPGKGNNFQRRLVAGGVSTSTAGAVVTAPYWVKLTRSGSSITAAQSADGVVWTTVGDGDDGAAGQRARRSRRVEPCGHDARHRDFRPGGGHRSVAVGRGAEKRLRSSDSSSLSIPGLGRNVVQKATPSTTRLA